MHPRPSAATSRWSETCLPLVALLSALQTATRLQLGVTLCSCANKTGCMNPGITGVMESRGAVGQV